MQVEDCKKGAKQSRCDKKEDPCAAKPKKSCPDDVKKEVAPMCCPPWFCSDKVKYPQLPSEPPEDPPIGVQTCKKKKKVSSCSGAPPPCTGPSVCYQKLKNPDEKIKTKK